MLQRYREIRTFEFVTKTLISFVGDRQRRISTIWGQAKIPRDRFFLIDWIVFLTNQKQLKLMSGQWRETKWTTPLPWAAVVHLNFRAGSTFPVLVCTVPSSMDRTSWCNKVDAVRLYTSYMLNLILLKGQRCVLHMSFLMIRIFLLGFFGHLRPEIL